MASDIFSILTYNSRLPFFRVTESSPVLRGNSIFLGVTVLFTDVLSHSCFVTFKMRLSFLSRCVSNSLILRLRAQSSTRWTYTKYSETCLKEKKKRPQGTYSMFQFLKGIPSASLLLFCSHTNVHIQKTPYVLFC